MGGSESENRTERVQIGPRHDVPGLCAWKLFTCMKAELWWWANELTAWQILRLDKPRASDETLFYHVSSVYRCMLNGCESRIVGSFYNEDLDTDLGVISDVGPETFMLCLGDLVSGGSGVGDVWRRTSCQMTATQERDFSTHV